MKNKDSIKNKYRQLSFYSEAPGQNEDSLVATLSELEGLAKAADIRIIEVRPDTEIKNSGSNRQVSVVLRVEADMPGYFKFLRSLEDSVSLLTINKFLLTSMPDSQNLEGTFYLSQIISS